VIGVVANRVELAGGKRRRYGSAAQYRRHGANLRSAAGSKAAAAASDHDRGSEDRAALAGDSAT
jgi:hypothetical protein